MKRIWIFVCALVALLPGSRAADRAALPPAPAKSPAPSTKVNLKADEADEYLATHPDAVVIDVRTPEEFQTSRLKGAANLNYYDPDFQKKAAALDKTKTYFIYCASGNRSSKARAIFGKLGLQKLRHLDGGIKAWEKAGKPIDRSAPRRG